MTSDQSQSVQLEPRYTQSEHPHWQDYLSSHPATDERIQALTKG